MAARRSLTHGEVDLARSVFANAIDYGRVTLVRGKWWPFQPRNSAMAPMGNIYFHPKGGAWSDDFSRESLRRQAFFIHEMTHVWQAQARARFYLPLMRHPFCRYSYDFKWGRPLARYGLEQQAEIMRHIFLGRLGIPPPTVPDLAFLEALLPFG